MRLRRQKQTGKLKLSKMAETKKIKWLAVLQGFSMLLVVIGHISLTNQPGDPSTPIATGIERSIYTFHMPLFIFISGWLFYYTCISRGKAYKEMLTSKVKRLVVPFLTFTFATMVLKMAFPQLVHRVVDMNEIIDTFILFRSNPLGEMWFIIVLFELMLLYPLYRVLTKNITLSAIGLGGTILISLSSISISYFNIGRVTYILPFFVAGILCCKYEWQKYLNNLWSLMIMAILFTAFNVIGILPKSADIIIVSTGIAFSFSLCLMLANFWPQLFKTFRDYTFQIFLMGIFFQMAIRWIYVRLDNEMFFVPMWLMSMVIGIFVPTVIAKLIKRYAPQKVRLCFGL